MRFEPLVGFQFREFGEFQIGEATTVTRDGHVPLNGNATTTLAPHREIQTRL